MKFKKKRKNLEAAQRWWDALPNAVKATLTRPGSVNQRTGAAAK